MTEQLGRFELRERLGRGGYGEVFRAYDPRLQREVALKVLHASDDSARLLREGRAAASIAHPNVVSVFDVGEVDGRAYLAMELLRGRTLRSYVGDDDVDLKTKLAWLVMVARALEAAHARGIVHRDVKPDNVFVTEDGVIKVLDFGIARQAVSVDREIATRTFDPMRREDVPLLEALTAQGVVHGTPDYMAPEQLRGERVTAAADQFAWGVMAYELIEGRRPWAYGDAVRQIEAVLFDEPPRMRRATGRVAVVVKRTLEKEAGRRFGGMGEAARRIVAPGATMNHRARHFTIFIGGFAALLFGTIMALRHRAKNLEERDGGVALSPRPSTSLSPNIHRPDAISLYRAGKRALFDGSRTLAIEQLESAMQLDSTLIEAELWWIIAHTFIGNELGRQRFADLQSRRSLLPTREQELFTAIEPFGWIPPNKDELRKRLETLTTSNPRDVEALFVRAKYLFMIFDFAQASEAADAILREDPNVAYAYRLKGWTAISMGQTDVGLASLQQCISVSPTATSCLELIHTHLANDGRCEEAEGITRRLIAIEPQNSLWYSNLADDLYGQDASEEAITLALEQSNLRMPARERSVDSLANSFALAILHGDTGAAEKIAHDWLTSVEVRGDDDAHMMATRQLILLLRFTGRDKEAIQTADAYLSKTRGWTHAGSDFDESFYIVQQKYLAGGLTMEARNATRSRWLDTETQRLDAERSLMWFLAFPSGCRSRSDAEDAIRELPNFRPLDDLESIGWREYFVGKMYLLARQRSDAIHHLERAAKSCSNVSWPFSNGLARHLLAQTYVEAGQIDLACPLLASVARLWGRPDSKLKPGIDAQKESVRLGCARTTAMQRNETATRK